VDAGREQVRALEDDAARHREFTHRLGTLETKCDELRATLKLVAEISTDQLVETQDARRQLDGLDTNGPVTEPNNEQTTSSSPPQESLPTDLDAPSRLDGNEPDSAQVESSARSR
jgi:hypothetical protein